MCGFAAQESMVIPCRIESPSFLLPQGLCSTGDAANRRRDAGFACRNAPPIFFLKRQKENAPCTVEKKKCLFQTCTQVQVWGKRIL